MTGENLIAIRVKRGLSQADFGKYLGVSARTILRWERGQWEIPAVFAKLLEMEEDACHAKPDSQDLP
jgi:transcriptional regulator with XRE-family HTH domain